MNILSSQYTFVSLKKNYLKNIFENSSKIKKCFYKLFYNFLQNKSLFENLKYIFYILKNKFYL